DDDAIPLKRKRSTAAEPRRTPAPARANAPVRRTPQSGPSRSAAYRSADASYGRASYSASEPKPQSAGTTYRVSGASRANASSNRSGTYYGSKANRTPDARPAASAQAERPSSAPAPSKRVASAAPSRQSGYQAKRPAPRTAVRSGSGRRKNAPVAKRSKFKKAFLIYACVLAVIFVISMIYIHFLLVKYERSQSDNVRDAKVTAIVKAARAGNIEKELSLEGVRANYSLSDEDVKNIEAAFANGKLTTEQNLTKYEFDKLNYDLILNGDVVGSISLKSYGEKTVLLIFPMADWKIESCTLNDTIEYSDSFTVEMNGEVIQGEPSDKPGMKTFPITALFNKDTVLTDSVGNSVSFDERDKVTRTDYTIIADANDTVYINDKAIDRSLAAITEDENFKFFEEFLPEELLDSAPRVATYNLTLLNDGYTVTVKNKSGVEAECERDGNTFKASGSAATDTFPQGLAGGVDQYFFLDIAKTWSLFMSQDLGGANNGFYQLAKYLIDGSYLYDVMFKYSYGVDITFTSDHTLDNPPFSSETIDKFTVYSDNFFSCHIALDKMMHLSDGQNIPNDMNSTFYFVYFDNTDNGVDDPAWFVAAEYPYTEA
ncbi:MAG: hypothetical protein IJQ80_06730, partial [Clostridia bacterium]|nr:hypothetical protein [Clostridia bacterium]